MLPNLKSQFLSHGGESYEEIPDHYFLWMHSAYKILLLKDKQHIDALAPVIYFLIIICLREGKKWEKGILNS